MTSTSSTKPALRVAVLLFPHADILDYAGPIEVLSIATYKPGLRNIEPVFDIKTVGRTEDAPIPTGGYGTISIQPSMNINELLETLPKFHILVVPGGSPDTMQRVLENDDGLELEVIKAFAKLPLAADGQERIVLSVCTGAFLLGAAGLLSGLKVTTHHLALEQLKKICDAFDAKSRKEGKTEVVGDQRFLDAGLVKDGLRVVTAGGVSSGIDAALHLVELVKDDEAAEFVASMIEFERRQK